MTTSLGFSRTGPARRDRSEAPSGENDRSRFQQIYEENFDDVLAYARRRVSSAGNAADVVAETFVVAWRRIGEIPHSAIRPWLFGVARLILSNDHRAERRRTRLAERLRLEIESRPPDPSQSTSATVVAALGRLSAVDREVLRLTCWENLSVAEVAQAMGISPSNARTRLSRARARMRRALEREQRINKEDMSG